MEVTFGPPEDKNAEWAKLLGDLVLMGTMSDGGYTVTESTSCCAPSTPTSRRRLCPIGHRRCSCAQLLVVVVAARSLPEVTLHRRVQDGFGVE